jgi:hypothetical protein
MSYFGHLAAGIAEGAGRGIVHEADLTDRRNAALDLQREKQAGALELARQRELDRADRERDNIALRAELAGANGSKGGKGGFNLFQVAMDTPPEKQGAVIEAVRAFQGDDAANVMARAFGRSPAGQEVNPTAGDFARYDRGQTESLPETSRQGVSVDVEKGRIGLQRLLALVADPGKYDDFAKGEARTVGTDAVRAALDSGKDSDLRKAGAVNMALEGKDRFGVAGDTSYDKAGIEAGKTTDVGRSKINENNASAAEHAAKAKNEREGTGTKANTLQSTQVDGNGYLLGVYRDGTVKRMLDERNQPITAAAFEQRVDRAAAALLKDGGSKYRKMNQSDVRAEARRNLLQDDGATAAPPPATPPAKSGTRPPLSTFQR